MEKDIYRHEGDNLGGVNRFRYLPIEGVQSMPETLNGAIHTEVPLKPDFRWYEGYCTEETMEYIEDQADGDHGANFKRSFVGQVPKDRPELVELFDSLKNGRFILDLFYNNGSRKLVGSPDEPMYFHSKLSTKKAVAGRNEYDISFAGEAVSNAPLYCV